MGCRSSLFDGCEGEPTMSWFQSVLQRVQAIIVKQSEDFILERLSDPVPAAVIKDQDYVSIIVKSARIDHVRRWTSQFYGCVQSRAHYLHVDRGDVEYQTVVVPALMKELDPKNLDKVIQIDKAILGPVPYVGRLSLELGLFSVKSTDLAGPYIDLLTSLAEKASVGFVSAALPFVEPLRKGADLLFGNAEQSELEIGYDRSWTNLETGYWVLMLAPKGSIKVSSLKVDPNDGRLLDARSNPLKGYPYLVFEVAKSDRRDDWMLIPELKAGWDSIAKAAKSGQLDDAEQQLKQFVLTCRWSPDLVPADQDRLAKAAAKKLPELQERTIISAGAVTEHPLGELKDLDPK
jgi:hypothetical protein